MKFGGVLPSESGGTTLLVAEKEKLLVPPRMPTTSKSTFSAPTRSVSFEPRPTPIPPNCLFSATTMTCLPRSAGVSPRPAET